MTPTQTLRVKPNGLPSGARIHVQAFQTRAALHAEILALRHQLLVLQLSSRDPQLPLGCADRFLLGMALTTGERLVISIGHREASDCDRVIVWRRKGFRLYWNQQSSHYTSFD